MNILQRCQDSLGELIDSDNNFNDFRNYSINQYGSFVACTSESDDEEVEPSGVKLNLCSGLKLTEIGANLDAGQQFIEVTNVSSELMDIRGCQLKTSKNSQFYSFGLEELSPGEIFVVKVADTKLGLIKTTSGWVSLLAESGAEIDRTAYSSLPKDSSWSLVEESWVASYRVTPGRENTYLQHPPCEAGYERNISTGRCGRLVESIAAVLADCGIGRERNPETGRCRNIPIASLPTPCKEGQYRSEDTGRCRSIALAASSLKVCADDQFRNPETNRCKKIASTDDKVLTDCGEGRERNPETNRCRTVLSATTTAKLPFSPEQITKTSQSMIGWWALGGVSLLAIGYAGWQWRWEASRLARQLKSAFTTAGK